MDTKDVQVALGKVIRRRRAALSYSQESFADAVEVHRTYMGAVERGECNISLRNMVRISTKLGIPLSTLIAETEALMAAPQESEGR